MWLRGFPYVLSRSVRFFILAAALAPSGWATPKYKVLYSFTGGDDGAYPNGSLLQDNLGDFYGTTREGGSSGLGTVFELMPTAKRDSWTLATLYAFTGGNDGGLPASGLIFDKYGTLHGTTDIGGQFGYGAIFRLEPAVTPMSTWTETVIYSFSSVISSPSGLAIDERGNLYGTTNYGGNSYNGTVFRLAPPANRDGTWTETDLYEFRGVPDGAVPQATVTIGKKGVLYGTTTEGGRGKCYGGNGYIVGCGAAFQLEPPTGHRHTWVETILYSFKGGADGYSPSSDLIFDKAGALYSTDICSAFKLEPQPKQGNVWVETTLYTFPCGLYGTDPYAGLVLDQTGGVFGTTDPGGIFGHGTVFELTPPKRTGEWNEKTLYTFEGYSANQPAGDLIFSRGALYGVAGNEIDSQYGIVFEIVP
jgi:uncharacterized repeat protein (TIGR03803 family)